MHEQVASTKKTAVRRQRNQSEAMENKQHKQLSQDSTQTTSK